MALEEVKEIDKIEIVHYGVVQVREATKILKDGEEISRLYHRWVFNPGSDVSSMPENVQRIAAAAWTPEVIAEFEMMNKERSIAGEE